MTYAEALEALGITDPASASSAYRELARSKHPDVGGSAEEFQRINEAYKVLRTPMIFKTADGRVLRRADVSEAQLAAEIVRWKRELTHTRGQLEIVEARIAHWDPKDFRIAQMKRPLEMREAECLNTISALES